MNRTCESRCGLLRYDLDCRFIFAPSHPQTSHPTRYRALVKKLVVLVLFWWWSWWWFWRWWWWWWWGRFSACFCRQYYLPYILSLSSLSCALNHGVLKYLHIDRRLRIKLDIPWYFCFVVSCARFAAEVFPHPSSSDHWCAGSQVGFPCSPVWGRSCFALARPASVERV